jgi:uncharacterized membrane protein
MISGALYDWLKAFHVIAVISWMAGMLYLPRLFVYHCDAPRARRNRKRSRLWNAGYSRPSSTPQWSLPGFSA